MEILTIASCAGLTRASIVLEKEMDCRVKPGNDVLVRRLLSADAALGKRIAAD